MHYLCALYLILNENKLVIVIKTSANLVWFRDLPGSNRITTFGLEVGERDDSFICRDGHSDEENRCREANHSVNRY